MRKNIGILNYLKETRHILGLYYAQKRNFFVSFVNPAIAIGGSAPPPLPGGRDRLTRRAGFGTQAESGLADGSAGQAESKPSNAGVGPTDRRT
jgi:hypothetical protein